MSSTTTTTKRHTTSRNLTYSYTSIPPSSPALPTLLLLHGFPSSPRDFHALTAYFSQRGYGIIAPDMLGYGDTDKPLGLEFYTGKGLAGDLKEILDVEGVGDGQVVGVGHDWGSFPLSRLANYYPSLLSKLVFLDVGYQPPGVGLTKQTIGFVNGMVKEKLGFEVFGYFLFFDEEGAVELMDGNVDSVQSLFHSKDEELVKQNMGAVGGTRKWLEEGKIAETGDYLSAEDKEYMRDYFAPKKGGYGAALNWYKAQMHDINAEEEKAIPQEAHRIKQPVLLLTSDNYISVSADFPTQMKQTVDDLTVENLHTGHWIMLEKPKETCEVIEKFIKR